MQELEITLVSDFFVIHDWQFSIELLQCLEHNRELTLIVDMFAIFWSEMLQGGISFIPIVSLIQRKVIGFDVNVSRYNEICLLESLQRQETKAALLDPPRSNKCVHPE